jgi:flagellar protein FliS
VAGFGARAYSKLGLETDVITGEPHRLILMLFDGALLSIQKGRSHLTAKRIAEKCQCLTTAIEIVDMGLLASIDARHDPEFAGRLTSLYRYVAMRLLQANVRNDVQSLDEAAKILGDLRAAWVQIAPAAAGTGAPPATVRKPPAETVASPARRVISAYQV